MFSTHGCLHFMVIKIEEKIDFSYDIHHLQTGNYRVIFPLMSTFKVPLRGMKKKNNRPIEVEIINYGIYREWERENSALPQFMELATEVPARVNIEFGMIVEIRKARGRYLDFEIDHPPFTDAAGNIEPPFRGTFRVKHNPFQFFLGDTVWDPVDDKKGNWKLSILLEEKVLVTKTLKLI